MYVRSRGLCLHRYRLSLSLYIYFLRNAPVVQDFKQHARGGISQSLSLFSMEEHPFLRSLWFYLHPCRTREMLAHLRQAPAKSSSRMWQWLSIMGPAVNLNIPATVLSRYIPRPE